MQCKTKSCYNCHFLAREVPPGYIKPHQETPFEMSKKTRQKLVQDPNLFDEAHFTVTCKQGIWHYPNRLDTDSLLETLCKKDRSGDKCFFEYTKGMSIPSAKKFHEQNLEREEAKKDRKLTQKGLWIAALALAADVLIQIYEMIFSN